MVFSYYQKLSANQRRIYRKSDSVTSVPLPEDGRWSHLVANLDQALKTEDRGKTEAVAQALGSALTAGLHVPPVRVVVLAKRPSRSWGELHGLYEPTDDRRPPRITVWMRTVRRRQVVAFRTFLRTLLHEVGHHLDYEWLELSDSFHTEGFYKRESSLLKQLLGPKESPDA
jgi:hypothetical protein